MCQLIIDQGGIAIVECQSQDIPIREEVMQSSPWRTLLPTTTRMKSCAVAAELTGHPPTRCQGHHILTNLPQLPDRQCASHHHAPGDKQCFFVDGYSCVV
eukprot:5355346-Amphidinium_carterae.1